MTVYGVRRKSCGCLVSSALCRDQSTPVGASKTHPNNDTTVVMSAADAARVPERCRGHKENVAERHQGLF